MTTDIIDLEQPKAGSETSVSAAALQRVAAGNGLVVAFEQTGDLQPGILLDLIQLFCQDQERGVFAIESGPVSAKVALEVMRRTGILEVTYPELLEQVGCEQNQWHAYDVWDHTMRVLDESAPDPVERIAALLHDVAKPRTRAKSDKTGDWTFYHHEKVGADMAERWLRDYRFSNRERELVVGLIRHHLICYSKEWTDAAVRRFIKRVGPERVDPLLRLGHADALGKGRNVEQELAALEELRDRIDRTIEEGNALTTQDLAIGGHDVVELLEGGAGPIVGEILRTLLDRVIEDPSLNTRDKLMPMVEDLASQAKT